MSTSLKCESCGQPLPEATSGAVPPAALPAALPAAPPAALLAAVPPAALLAAVPPAALLAAVPPAALLAVPPPEAVQAAQVATPQVSPEAVQAAQVATPQVSPEAALAAQVALIRSAAYEGEKFRYKGVTQGTYSIESMNPFMRLPVEAGIGQICRQSPVPFDRATGDDDFCKRLAQAAPFLTGFDLPGNGLALAGGAPSHLLQRAKGAIKDYDLFFVGRPDGGPIQTSIDALGRHLYKCARGALKAFRTRGCVTFVGAAKDQRRIECQVVLRNYSSLAEVLHSFDLGSSAVAWDGQRVHLTALSKVAFELGVNILNLNARRASYENRICKYWERGFNLVLPELGAGFTGRLPYLSAPRAVKVGPACYATEALWPVWPGAAPAAAPAAPEALYDASVPYGSLSAIYARNVRALEKSRPEALCAFSAYVPGLGMGAIEPDFDRPDLLMQLVAPALSSRKADLKTLSVLLGPKRAAEALLKAVSGDAAALKAALEAACEDRATELQGKPHDIPFEVMGVEDATLIAPFSLAGVSVADWYGSAWAGPAAAR
jgi:hypothetical protein